MGLGFLRLKRMRGALGRGAFWGALWAILASCSNVPLARAGIPLPAAAYDFESGGMEPWMKNYAEEGISALIVSDQARRGLRCLKFTVRPEDRETLGNRSEIYLPGSANYGTESYYGWSFMIPVDYAESGEWQVIGQFHDLPDFEAGENFELFPPTHPPVSMVYQDGALTLTINTPYNYPYQVATRGIAKGQWHDVVLRVLWSTGWDGYVEAWLDGEHLTPSKGGDYRVFRPTLNNRSGNYLKIGLYRSMAIRTVNSVYFDEVRIGDSFQAVAP